MYFLSENTSITVAKYVLSLVPFAAQQNKGLIQFIIASDQVPRKVRIYRMALRVFSNVTAVIIPSVNKSRQEEGKKEEKLKI
jgi:hypothetical protein